MKNQVFTNWRFIDAVTLSYFNDICYRFFLNHIYKYFLDTFQHVKTNIAERNVFTATKHEPKVKEKRHRYLSNVLQSYSFTQVF